VKAAIVHGVEEVTDSLGGSRDERRASKAKADADKAAADPAAFFDSHLPKRWTSSPCSLSASMMSARPRLRR
jgi:hypothetical protein